LCHLCPCFFGLRNNVAQRRRPSTHSHLASERPFGKKPDD